MLERLSEQWARAQALEAAQDRQGAKAIYEGIVRDDPGHAAALMRLSTIALAGDHYRSTHLYALKAAQAVKERRNWKMLPYVSQRLLLLGERNTVRELIKSADWSHRDVIAQSAVLSQQLWLVEAYGLALELIEHVRPRVQASHLLHYSRANALRYCGRMEEATAEFEASLALAPDYPSAHWSLAYHKASDPPGARIDRIKRAKASAKPGSEDWAYLCHALFKEYDDAGDVDLAWEQLQAGTAAMRRLVAHDATQEASRIQALIEMTGEGFYAGMSSIQASRTPLFVVGMPRTGTTVLERILSNHPHVATGGELNDFATAMSWELDHVYASPLAETTLARTGAVDFSLVGKDYLRRTESVSGSQRYLVDKNPMNFLNTGFIHKALPQAKVICMQRDPMDACFSNLKELFSGHAYPYSYDLADLADHYIGFERLRGHWQEMMPEAFLTIRYETMVGDGESTIGSLQDFCGFQMSADQLAITSNTAPVSTASSSQVREPIHDRNVGSWKRYAKYLQPLQDRLQAAGLSAE